MDGIKKALHAQVNVKDELIREMYAYFILALLIINHCRVHTGGGS